MISGHRLEIWASGQGFEAQSWSFGPWRSLGGPNGTWIYPRATCKETAPIMKTYKGPETETARRAGSGGEKKFD